MKRLLLVFAIIFCLSACSDKFELGYRVVQMEDDSYIIQEAVNKHPRLSRSDAEWEWKHLYRTNKGVIVERNTHAWYMKEMDVFRFSTRQKACIECNELIQGKINKESPFKVRRLVKCN